MAAAVAMLVASPAQAGPLVASAPDCDSRTLEKPFRPWADLANYVLAPNGTAEDDGLWTLTGGAGRDFGNEPFHVHGADEVWSLALPAGSTATTASICVGLEHPTLRFFARNEGSVLSSLEVEVLFEDASGAVRSAPIGLVLGTWYWQPTLQMPIVASLLALLPGEYTPVAFRFTAAGGSWRIDDVYVDPWRHG